MTIKREVEIEKEIKEKNLNAPRLTPEHIDDVIADVKFHQFEGTTTIACCIVLKNGYTVIGHSACASPENFDFNIGSKIAYEAARQKIWQLEGYLLKEKLYIKERFHNI